MAKAFGARGVGLGRPFLWAQTAYGEQGVIRTIRSESSRHRSGPADDCSHGERDRHGDAPAGYHAARSSRPAARRMYQGDMEVATSYPIKHDYASAPPTSCPNPSSPSPYASSSSPPPSSPASTAVPPPEAPVRPSVFPWSR